MQVKWLEDLVALAETRSFTRAAESRHVTHPAFGRRIRELEQWAGVPLVVRGGSPVVLTAAGEILLRHARQTVDGLSAAQRELRGGTQHGQPVFTLGTGRTLARTIAADWLWRVRGLTAQAMVHVRTGAMADALQRLEHREIDFMLSYHHPLIALRLRPAQHLQHTVAHDRLVPVSRVQPSGQPLFRLDGDRPLPFLSYAGTLALGHLVSDHLANHAQAPRLRPTLEADSADALLEYVQKGLGVAWLPWSLAVGACQQKKIVPLGGKAMEIGFEVRMVRDKRRLSPLAERLWEAVVPV
ncbi:LysR family transcriptional regulator [Xenophilus aerolatus]|nr:LysR family transcriptional regulator [Xenophilus aerolatus]